MKTYTLYVLLFLNTVYVLSAPTEEGFNVYEKLVKLGEDEKYKCPYLRETMLLKPRPPFLESCYITDSAIHSKEFSPILATYTLCSLYYESFKNLCMVMPELKPDVVKIFSPMVLKTKLGLNKTCETLGEVGKSVKFEMSLPEQLIKDGDLCRRFCADKEGAVSLCEWSALMLNELHSANEAVKPMLLEKYSKEVVNPPRQNEAAVIPSEVRVSDSKPIDNPNKQLKPVPTVELQEKTNTNVTVEVKPKAISPQVLNSNQEPTNQAAQNANIITDSNDHLLKSIQVNPTNPNPNPPMNGGNINSIKENNSNIKTTPIKTNPPANSHIENMQTENTIKAAATDNINTQTANKNKPEIESPLVGVEANDNNAEENFEMEGEGMDNEEDKNVKLVPTTSPDLSAAQNVPVEPQQPQLEKEDSKKSNNIAYDEDDEDDVEYSVIDDAKKSGDRAKPLKIYEDNTSLPSSYTNQSIEEDDSYFFSYFMMICIVFILGYVGYHNKQKILAMVLEGRRGKRQQRRPRPNSANYHKLDSNLEEAVTSSCTKNTTNIIY